MRRNSNGSNNRSKTEPAQVEFVRRHSVLVSFRASNRKMSLVRWITCRRCQEVDTSALHLTIGMSRSLTASGQDGAFPFGRLDDERREPPEVRHLRDNSRYLLQNGLRSAASGLVIYLRGIVMNAIVLMPILLVVAAFISSERATHRGLIGRLQN